MDAPVIPVLIAGGAGTRLWPASRQARPKPFQTFGLPHSLLQDTVLRFRGPMFADPVVICSERHVDLVRAHLEAIGVGPLAIIAEPEGRNTGPAVVAAAAAGAARWPGAPMILVHADNVVADVPALHAEIAAGLPAARAGQIVIFGVRPTGPSTDYGYIEAGEPDPADGVLKVVRFVEKPPLEEARRMADDPRYGWNAGLFLIDPPSFLEEARRLAPDMAAAVEAAAAAARFENGVLSLPPAFSQAPAVSVDTAILERTDRARVRTGEFGWSDAGSWRALWESGPRDAAGNVLNGDVTATDSRGVLVHSDGASVVLVGVEDLVVVVQDGLVMVAARDRADQAHKTIDFSVRPDLK